MASGGPGPRQTSQSQGASAMSDNIWQIVRIGKALLVGFIKRLWQQYTASHPKASPLELTDREDLSVEEDIPDATQVTSLQDYMLCLWEELSSNAEITSMAESVRGENPLKALADVSEQMFADGINWGRIVVFFYFSYKVIAQSSGNWFDTVVDWAMNFLKERLASWIQQKGGWFAMLNYFPSSAQKHEERR